jgi:hypothetical protein
LGEVARLSAQKIQMRISGLYNDSNRFQSEGSARATLRRSRRLTEVVVTVGESVEPGSNARQTAHSVRVAVKYLALGTGTRKDTGDYRGGPDGVFGASNVFVLRVVDRRGPRNHVDHVTCALQVR